MKDTADGTTPPGAPQGGQFALGGGRVAAQGRRQAAKRPAAHHAAPKKPSGPRRFGYNPKTNQGVGYGVKGGDADVRILQSSINRLGLTDDRGKPLAVDGRYGPRTTAAVKKLQKSLGLAQSGQVDENLIKQVSAMKTLPVRRSTDMPDDDQTSELIDLLGGLPQEDIDEIIDLAEAMHAEGDDQ